MARVTQGTTATVDAVVFDLGGVLIDWNPRYVFRSLFDGDEAGMERFLDEVCSPAWNLELDAGRPWREAVDALVRQHPERRDMIAAYDERWPEMLGGPIQGTVEVLAELRAAGIRLAALTNWSAEKFPIARARYDFLDWFEVIVVSGDVGLCKPDERIYRILLERTGLRPSSTAYVDDLPINVAAAARIGFVPLPYEDPTRLRRDLATLGVLDAAAA
jgi:2-haloacid dehalogenase